MSTTRVSRRRVMATAGLLFLSLAAGLQSCGGPRHLERYPPRETSPYVLPFQGSRWVVQGNNGVISHSGWQEFAWDFVMPEDTPITAARAGVVTFTRADKTKFGFKEEANEVAVKHEDGTTAWYLHLRPQGVLVEKGERVRQGQEIARSGMTGRAAMPHLHFHVTKGGTTIPVTFRDVEGDGIPRSPWCVGK